MDLAPRLMAVFPAVCLRALRTALAVEYVTDVEGSSMGQRYQESSSRIHSESTEGVADCAP